jgi:hypothetical protein
VNHISENNFAKILLEESIMTQSNIRSDLGEELRNAPVEPLLPIEKKLIGWSLTIGLILLVVLAVINHFFPVAPT